VSFGERALREGDVEQFGQYLFQSHDSSREFFHNSCPELDILVEIATSLPGCLGARLTGGGFGGATINLVRSDSIASFSSAISTAYAAQTGRKMEPLVCQVVDGAE
jgi:galactokinase